MKPSIKTGILYLEFFNEGHMLCRFEIVMPVVKPFP